jgi:Lsr2
MAKSTVTILTDDIDGGEATETISFGLDGSSYEIDLNDKNASEFREALAPYVAAARRASGSSTGQGRSATAARPRTSGDVDAKKVRAWAEANGVEVSARGRISADVIDKYKAANT